MILDKLDSEAKKEYECIWDEKVLSKFDIDNTPTTKGFSKSSLAFVQKDLLKLRDKEIESKINTLVDNFKIDDKDLFSKKFNMSISGSGNELTNMLSIKSSALCPLLFFYNCENKPIKMNLIDKSISFDKSYFEWKNKVIKNPSNMDVVLYSSKDNILLFIESKFTEYLKKNQNRISSSYLKNDITGPIYNKLFDQKYYEPLYVDNSKDYFYLKSDEPHYTEGIKQNISHYCGIRNFLNNQIAKDNSYRKELQLNKDTKYFFTEILFTNKKLEEKVFSGGKISCFEDYSKQYSQLAEILNADIKARGIKNFTILPELYTYTKLKDDNPDLNKEIVNFYFSK